jgi:GNAT superfamily N-acetyltransferase
VAVEIAPFEDAHLTDAARLLSRRHALDRRALPLLPDRYEQEALARAAVAAAWGKARTSGVVALDGGNVAGYLFGSLIVSMPWPRCYWVDLAGHALAEERDAELYRDMYAAASADWVEAGAFDHFALVPSHDRSVVDAWFDLSFGKQQVHALMELGDAIEPEAAPYEIRRVGPEDVELIADLRGLIADHQAGSPTFAPQLPEFVAALFAGHDEILADPTVGYWVAVEDGRALGFQAYIPVGDEDKGLNVPDSCIELSVAATRPDARGKGVGMALTQIGLAWAAREGYTHCLTDWRAANLLSSRFWPARGFVPVTFRLHRGIDARVAWAR